MLADRFLPHNAAQVTYQKGLYKERCNLTKDQILFSIVATRHVDTFHLLLITMQESSMPILLEGQKQLLLNLKKPLKFVKTGMNYL